MAWKVTRYKLSLVALACLCSACDALPEATQKWKAAEFAIYGRPDVPVERIAIDASPYASIGASMGASGRVVMVLGRYDGPELHWISADRVAIATRDGRIVKTAGLAENLKNTEFVGKDPVGEGLHRLDHAKSVRRMIDVDTGNLYGLTVISELQPVGRETIEILGRTYETVVVRETGAVGQLGWEFENYFWVDAKTGFVWKSRQHTTPNTPTIEFEILKPAT